MSKEVIKVSIIVPVYNVEKYLDKCVQSLVNQTYKNIEILLIDDGSTDLSGAICDGYARRYDNIRVFHKPNGGVSSARNSGIEKASGIWIMFVDGDDWLDLDAIEFLLQREDDEHDIIAASYTWEIDKNCSRYASPCTQTEYSYDCLKKRKYLLGLCLTHPREAPNLFPYDMRNCSRFAVVVAKLYRISFLQQNNLLFKLNRKLGEDILFNLSALSVANKIKFIDKSIYHYFIRKGSAVNSQYPAERCRELIEQLSDVCTLLNQYGLIDEMQRFLSYYSFKFFEEIAQFMGMTKISTTLLAEYRKILEDFCVYCKNDNISTNLDINNIKPLREKLIFFLYRTQNYFFVIFICWLYYKFFPSKKKL